MSPTPLSSKSCSSCGAELPATAMFCMVCGAKQDTTPRPDETASQTVASADGRGAIPMRRSTEPVMFGNAVGFRSGMAWRSGLAAIVYLLCVELLYDWLYSQQWPGALVLIGFLILAIDPAGMRSRIPGFGSQHGSWFWAILSCVALAVAVSLNQGIRTPETTQLAVEGRQSVLGILLLMTCMVAVLAYGLGILVNFKGIRDDMPLIGHSSRHKFLGWLAIIYLYSMLVAIVAAIGAMDQDSRVEYAPAVAKSGSSVATANPGQAPVPAVAPTRIVSPPPTTVPQTPTPMPTATSVPPTPTPNPRVGDVIVKGNWAYAVGGVKKQKTFTWTSFGNKETAKGIWLIVVLGAKNLGDRTMRLNSWDFELRDLEGNTYEMNDGFATRMFNSDAELANMGEECPPGVLCTMGLFFDVNPDAEGYRLFLKQADNQFIDLSEK